MSQELFDQKILDQIEERRMALKLMLEQVSKLRIDTARMQLEYLKLYKPQILEMLEPLQTVSEDPSARDNNDMLMNDDVKSREGQRSPSREWEDVSRTK